MYTTDIVRTNEETAKQTRVNSAVSILQYAARFTETADIIERLETIEEAQAMSDERGKDGNR